MRLFCPLSQEEGDEDVMFKMVFVVNMELSMGVGKVYVKTVALPKQLNVQYKVSQSADIFSAPPPGGSAGGPCSCGSVPGHAGEEYLERDGLEMGPCWVRQSILNNS